MALKLLDRLVELANDFMCIFEKFTDQLELVDKKQDNKATFSRISKERNISFHRQVFAFKCLRGLGLFCLASSMAGVLSGFVFYGFERLRGRTGAVNKSGYLASLTKVLELTDLFGKSNVRLVEGSFSTELGALFKGNQIYDYFVGFYLVFMSVMFYVMVEWNLNG